MTLQQLEYFVTLAKIEHFTKASKALSISQPSLSYAISQLEGELGVELFDRVGKKIKLNSYGNIFLTYVETALSTIDRGKENLKLLTKKNNESIKIGYIYSLTNTLLSDIIKEFYKDDKNKNISFEFNNNSNDKIVQNIENGSLDLALCVIPPQNGNYVKLFEQELFLMVPKSNEFAKKKEIKIEELKNLDFINYSQNTGLRMITDKIFKSHNISPNVKLEVDECNAALSFVYLNIGFTIMPMVPGIDTEKVVPVRIKEIKPNRNIYLVWNESINSKENISRLRDFIIELYKDRTNYIDEESVVHLEI